MGRRLLSVSLPSLFASAFVAGASLVSSPALAVGISDYGYTRSFTLPTPSIAFSNVLFDALPDGRLVALNDTTLLRETAVKSGTFATVGTVGNFSTSYGASFLTVSPDGTHAAVGSNGGGTVTVFDTTTPSAGTAYAADDSDAAWLDNGRLAISNGQGVQVLDTGTGQVKTVVSNIGGFSGGVAVDAAGNLYTGNGYSTSAGSGTGLIKAFSGSSIDAASATGASAIDFQTSGSAVADLLSAGSIGFDASGNFFVGGGDFFGTSGDYGYAGLVDASAVQAALAAASLTPTIDVTSASAILRKFTSPAETVAASQAPGWGYNAATGELYLRYAYGDGTVNVYSVPEPAMLSVIGLAAIGALRRRRRAIAGVVLAGGMAAASTAQAYVYDPNDFATEVVSSTGLAGSTLYNEPTAVLGRPTLKFNNGSTASPDYHRAKLIEGTFNTGTSGEKLITTLNAGQSITVKMGRAITDDPSHPFGVDFNVFGNAFFVPGNTGGFTGDDTNLNTATLGSIFSENVRISVSPDGVNWYSYASPTGDGYFPTNAYRWDRASASWADDELDPRIPVNPALAGTIAGMTAADALDAYAGSAGGAGFDLAASGFASVQYVRFDGLTGYSGGEIDAVAAVPEPAGLLAVGLAGLALLRRR